MDPACKNIYLPYTTDEKAEGGERILQVLKKNDIKASFFFTGNFLRNSSYKSLIKKIINNGHYVGPNQADFLDTTGRPKQAPGKPKK